MADLCVHLQQRLREHLHVVDMQAYPDSLLRLACVVLLLAWRWRLRAVQLCLLPKVQVQPSAQIPSYRN